MKSPMAQRDLLRSLYRKYRGDKSATIKAYADGERRGIVKRESNVNSLTPERYAAKLLADALKRGFISGSPE